MTADEAAFAAMNTMRWPILAALSRWWTSPQAVTCLRADRTVEQFADLADVDLNHGDVDDCL